MITRYLAALLAAIPLLAVADLDTARQQIESEQLDAAKLTLERHLAEEPNSAEARFLLGRLLAWELETDKALRLFDGLLSRQPNNADYLLARGQASLWGGRPQEALVPLERAAKIAPDYPDIQDALRQARASVGESPAIAQVSAEPVAAARNELELSARQDWLNRGFANWRAQRLTFSSTRVSGPGWYGALLREERFAEHDKGIELGALLPLDNNWMLQPEIGYQPSPFFLPEWHVDLRVQRVLPDGYIGAASVRRTEYRATRVNRLALAGERYWGAWRAGYTLNISDVADAGTPVGHHLALDNYYDGLSYVGLRLTAGNEEAVEEQQLITSSVRAASLQGRHWFTPQWALSWELGHHRQGTFYDRNSLQVGLRHAF